MSRAAWSVVLGLALAALPSCGSIAMYRVPATIVSPTRSLPIELWSRDTSLDQAIYVFCWDTLLWPVDAFVSVWSGCVALFDPDVAIRGGPFGLLLAVALPGCTAHGGANGPSLVQGKPRLENPDRLEVTEDEFDRYLVGEMSLRELTVRGLAAEYRELAPSTESIAFHLAERVLVKVRDGQIPVSEAGAVTSR